MLRRFHPLPLVLIALGLVTAIATLQLRHRAESRSRAVALVMDYGQFRLLSSAAGVPVQKAFHRFKSAGITGVALSEETLADLQAGGFLDARTVASDGAREYQVRISESGAARRVVDSLSHLSPAASSTRPDGDRVVFTGPEGEGIYVAGRFEDIRSTPVGLDPEEVEAVRAAGLTPVARINNPLSLKPDTLRWLLGRVKEQGIGTVIFAGEEVLGYRGLIPQTAEAFRELGLLYGSVEFGKQRGDEQLSARLQDRLVRVHSITSAEMARLPVTEAVERYVRAAMERNIRLNYIRLPVAVTEQTFDDALEYVEDVATTTAAAGFGLASPVPLGEVWPDPMLERAARALIGLGIGAAAALLLAGLVPLSRRAQAGLVLASGLLCALLAFSGVSIGLQMVALLAAVVFPTLAFVLFPQPVAAFQDPVHPLVRKPENALAPAVAQFAAISLVTLAGAVMLAALLSELAYMVKIESFAGIKLATVAPLGLVGIIYLTGLSGEYSSWAEERDAVLGRLRRFFAEPVHVWHTVAMLVALVALALLVARSGNDPGVGVSNFELRFRALLDRFLGVRPRTKEFLLGHPALLLGLALAAMPRWRAWAFPLLLVGIIGQTGMLNSFCHLHTPIKLTLIRTFHGLWIGGAIGIGLIL
ncbi:MAG TPA: DUF5693 family protein, partial [Armatimonadota bacterium]|nr:DUF5693 family protein [Armatimonadota bacterium]